jgi:hypothetical protein
MPKLVGSPFSAAKAALKAKVHPAKPDDGIDVGPRSDEAREALQEALSGAAPGGAGVVPGDLLDQLHEEHTVAVSSFSAIADFLADFGSDSDDGVLPPPPDTATTADALAAATAQARGLFCACDERRWHSCVHNHSLNCLIQGQHEPLGRNPSARYAGGASTVSQGVESTRLLVERERARLTESQRRGEHFLFFTLSNSTQIYAQGWPLLGS